MKTVSAACPLDCPDACSLTVTVDESRIVSVDGNDDNPVTGGYICAKVRRFPEVLYDEHRIRTPGIRDGAKGSGTFRKATWDEALERIVQEFRRASDQYGAESILPFSYGGSNGFLSQDTTDARLFWRLGASRLARTVCAAATGRAAEGLYGKMAGVGYEDYVHAKLIVVWGANPVASGIHLVPYIQEAQKNGAKLVVVDPRRTKLAARADLHLALRPGTDLPLALSIINWFLEQGREDAEFLEQNSTGLEGLRARAADWDLSRAAEVCQVSRDDLETFANMYADTSPAIIRSGWGMERNRNGGSAVAAVLALPAIAGKFDIRGGGYTMSNSSVWDKSIAGAANAAPPDTRVINMNKLGQSLGDDMDPRIHALFVYNCNPLTTMPNQEAVRQGLLREDLFTVVFDSFMTDTAAMADVVLPATTFLERREILRGYGAYVMHDVAAAIDPVGESRTNHDVFEELCGRLGLDQPDDPRSEEDVALALLGDGNGSRIKGTLDRDGIAFPEFGTTPVQFKDVFPRTSDRKVHLFPEALDREAPRGLYTYQEDPETEEHPLALISPNHNRAISSTMGQLLRDQVPLTMHSEDARDRNIKTGNSVRVFNELGEVRCNVRVDASVRSGVVELSKGIWAHNTLSSTTSNALSPDTLTDLGQGACFNDARVQVERID